MGHGHGPLDHFFGGAVRLKQVRAPTGAKGPDTQPGALRRSYVSYVIIRHLRTVTGHDARRAGPRGCSYTEAMTSLLAIGRGAAGARPPHRGSQRETATRRARDSAVVTFWAACAITTGRPGSGNTGANAPTIRSRSRPSSGSGEVRSVGRGVAGAAPPDRVWNWRSSVAIAAASPHRADAYAACRYAIERVKQIAPVWKREFFDGGDVWIEGAIADPADETARAEAERIACA